MGKYQENWRCGKYEKYELEKYQDYWKYGKFEKFQIANMEKLKNVKDDARNERESIVGEGGKCKNPKGYTME